MARGVAIEAPESARERRRRDLVMVDNIAGGDAKRVVQKD